MATSATGASAEEQEFFTALASLGAARSVATYPTEPGKAFELWLEFRLADYWSRHGATVELLDGAGNSLAPNAGFVTRGNPGHIARANAAKPGSIRVNFRPGVLDAMGNPVAEYELHGSVQFHGRSAALHECDISLIPADLARRIRARPLGYAAGYAAGLPPVALECKKHKKSGPVGEAREMVARLFDITRVRDVVPKHWGQLFWPVNGPSVGGGCRYIRYRDQFQDGYYAIVRSAGFTRGALRLNQHYNIHSWGNMRGSRSDFLAAAIQSYLCATPWEVRDGTPIP